MDSRQLLEHSYEVERGLTSCPPESRLDFLGLHIFDFTTYDSKMSALFARKALEVALAITDGKTFRYIESPEDYHWYLVMCNMPFFSGKLNWGTSIRGAWWDEEIRFRSSGLWVGEEQMIDEARFSKEEWGDFIYAIRDFVNLEPQ